VTNEEKVNQVIALMDAGTSERSACEQVGINRGTFRSAALKVQAVDQYAKALEAMAQDQVELVEQTIEDMRSGKIDHKMAKVEIDARKWFASKFLPKRYGDKITQEISGPDGAPIQSQAVSLDPAQESALQQVIEDAKSRIK
jgi:hypothetical protein